MSHFCARSHGRAALPDRRCCTCLVAASPRLSAPSARPLHARLAPCLAGSDTCCAWLTSMATVTGTLSRPRSAAATGNALLCCLLQVTATAVPETRSILSSSPGSEGYPAPFCWWRSCSVELNFMWATGTASWTLAAIVGNHDGDEGVGGPYVERHEVVCLSNF